MANRVTVYIAGEEFTLISEEDEAYMHRVAALVDAEVRAIRDSAPQLAVVSTALLAAVNLGDNLLKAQDSAEHLRGQLRDYLEDATRMRSELGDLRREVNRLRKESKLSG